MGVHPDCLAKRIPVTPAFVMPKTIITKDDLEEGGLGIHVLKNVLREAGGSSSRTSIIARMLPKTEAAKELMEFSGGFY